MPATQGGKKRAGKARPRCRSGRQRMKMRPWLEKLLKERTVPGLEWRDRELSTFSIRWKHASGRSFKTEEDSDLFMRYAIHTGKYADGMKDHKRWKANFRCALHSLDDVEELHEESNKKGEKAVRVYRFLEGPKNGPKQTQQGSEETTAAKNLELITESSPVNQQEAATTAEVKMEVRSPGCSFPPMDSPPRTDGEDTDGEHNYSKNEQDGIPKLHTFNHLLTGGSVEICVSADTTDRPPALLTFEHLHLMKPEQPEYTGCATPESEMSMMDVVEMVSGMEAEFSDSGYSDTDTSRCSNSPEHHSLWGTDFGLEGSQRAKVVTEPIPANLTSQDSVIELVPL